MGGYVVLEYMSFRMTCLRGTLVLRKVMLCRKMSCRSACLIFQDDASYWNAFFTGEHVLLEGISYRRSCLTGVHVLENGISYSMIYPTGRHILQEDTSYWCVCVL